SPAAGAVAWAWSTGELLLTRDGGATWARVAVPDGGSIDRLQAVGAEGAWVAARRADGRRGPPRGLVAAAHARAGRGRASARARPGLSRRGRWPAPRPPPPARP